MTIKMLLSTSLLIYLIMAYLLIFFSIVTLLFERKFIAIAQKRLGISFLGRNGWIHLPADMVKFWFKFSSRHEGSWITNSTSTLVLLVGFFCWNLLACFFFLTDMGGCFLDHWDYQFLVYFGYANLTAAYMFNIIVNVKSKFATIASVRILLLTIFLEIFFACCFFIVYIHIGGYSFEELSELNKYNWLIFSLPPLALFFGIYTLFEAKRAPFDHTEAESELVSGHLIEYGGRLLLFFYFSEYVHVYFCLFLIVTVIFGGADSFVLSNLNFIYFADCYQFIKITIFYL